MCRIFGNCKREPAKMADYIAPVTKTIVTVPASAIEYRPCWVAGKKAIFHRWVNAANPSLPKGQDASEATRYFQHRSTKALVEFEDGTVDLVWPYSVKFADHGKFEEYAWEPMEEKTNG